VYGPPTGSVASNVTRSICSLNGPVLHIAFAGTVTTNGPRTPGPGVFGVCDTVKRVSPSTSDGELEILVALVDKAHAFAVAVANFDAAVVQIAHRGIEHEFRRGLVSDAVKFGRPASGSRIIVK